MDGSVMLLQGSEPWVATAAGGFEWASFWFYERNDTVRVTCHDVKI